MTIADIPPQTRVSGHYLVLRKEVRQGGRAGSFLDLTLCDATGRVSAKVWDNAAAISEQFQQGDVIEVSGGELNVLDNCGFEYDCVEKITHEQYVSDP